MSEIDDYVIHVQKREEPPVDCFNCGEADLRTFAHTEHTVFCLECFEELKRLDAKLEKERAEANLPIHVRLAQKMIADAKVPETQKTE